MAQKPDPLKSINLPRFIFICFTLFFLTKYFLSFLFRSPINSTLQENHKRSDSGLMDVNSGNIFGGTRVELLKGVWKEIKVESNGEQVEIGKRYASQVTLYIENKDGTLVPSGWSTVNSELFTFSPGINLIEGWSVGALSMKVGERAMIHVPANMGYGSNEQGAIGAGWYIPANSNLCFDLEILKKI